MHCCAVLCFTFLIFCCMSFHSCESAATSDTQPPTHPTPHSTKHNTQHTQQTNKQYHPERLLPALEGLPRPFLRERALLLSRLGRHEAVLRLYVESLGDAALAEAYCEEVRSCVCCVFVFV